MTSLARWVGRSARILLQLTRPGGGSSLPGLMASRISPDFIRATAALFAHRIVITGTNGKTSTTHLLSSFLKDSGLKVLHNAEGANLPQGIATTLLEPPRDTLVLEVDEAALELVINDLLPHWIVITGLFRDQLDRYGEVHTVRERLLRALAKVPAARLLLNADDPLVASLGREQDRFFSLKGLGKLEVPADVPGCPRCKAPLSYSERSYGHLGVYACAACGFSSPKADYPAEIAPGYFMVNGRALPPLPVYLHPYSAAAAVAAAMAMGHEPHLSAWPAAAWGRGETQEVLDRHLVLALVKNPASFSWNLAWLPADRHILQIDDQGADGRDVSWLWDVSYQATLRKAYVTGARSLEMLIRLKYLDPVPQAAAFKTARGALAAALQQGKPGESVLILSTYTGLKTAQSLLHNPEERASEVPTAVLTPPPPHGPGTRILRLVHLFPEEMGTYGDGGNFTVMQKRLAWRGFGLELVRVGPGDALPADADFFLLGGGEDQAQERVAPALSSMRDRLAEWIESGVAGLLVCGGLQLFGESYETPLGIIAGLGLLPLVTRAGSTRLVGRIMVESTFVKSPLVGFENHAGYTRIMRGKPLGTVRTGHGNQPHGAGHEGLVHQHVIATYLHGPVLARNPWLADLLIGWALSRRDLEPLEPLDDELEHLALRRLIRKQT